MKKYLILATAALALAACSKNGFDGDPENLKPVEKTAEIVFGSSTNAMTRADQVGSTAAATLGNNFIVEGTKGATETDATTSEVVFDNYVVVFEENTANTTESNTHNWEYVGKTETSSTHLATDLFTALGRDAQTQSIHYWDYSADQYDFVAYSTGTKTMVSGAPANGNEVRVTLINDVNKGYVFEATSADALTQCYVSEIVTVPNTSFGNPVVLKFKNLGAKIRFGIYESIPGYSVRDVEFYVNGTNKYTYEAETASAVAKKDVFKVDVYDNAVPATLQHKAGDNWVAGTWYNNANPQVAYTEAEAKKTVLTKVYYESDGTEIAKGTEYDGSKTYHNRVADAVAAATLYGGAMPESGVVTVTYPVVGSNYKTVEGYNKPSVTVAAGTATSTTKDFGALVDLHGPYANEVSTGNVFIGTTSNTATFAGVSTGSNYYQNVIPNPTGGALTLRVNYTLEATDGSGEEIKVWGATAIVPAIYAQWQPNYAYTYLFKISDKTNGSTKDLEGTVGLFPITFDAVVAEYTDMAAEQTTITTVATPSITTYQKGHKYNDTDEYLASKGDIYVMVKNSTAALIGDLATDGKLYTVNASASTAGISEATVADALTMQKSNTSGTIVGRNKLVLTPAPVAANFTKIPGVDGNDITITAGEAAKFAPAAGTYAYVYTTPGIINTYAKFQPVTKAVDADVEGLYPLAYTAIDDAKTASQITSGANAEGGKVYFAVTTVGATTTYTYVSTIVGKPVANGLVWVDMSSVAAEAASAVAVANTFYFDKYTQNDGQYAVKVIKVQ